MKLKKILLAIVVFFVVFFVVFLVIFLYVMIPYWKYDKITFNDAKPEIRLQDVLKNENIKVKYDKTYLFDDKFLGADAIVNDSTFMNITFLGKANYKEYNFIKSNKEFELDRLWKYVLADSSDIITKSINSINYPFNIKRNIFYHNYNKENKDIIDKDFTEIIYSDGGTAISFDNKIINLSYFSPLEGNASLSFINYNGKLYLINVYPLFNTEFKTLHSFYDKSPAGATVPLSP